MIFRWTLKEVSRSFIIAVPSIASLYNELPPAKNEIHRYHLYSDNIFAHGHLNKKADLNACNNAEASSCPSICHRYVILGYGVAGIAALSALIDSNPNANVLVIDEKLHVRNLTNDLKDMKNVSFTNASVKSLDAKIGTVTIETDLEQKVIGFEKCLISTGISPIAIPDGYIDSASANYVVQLENDKEFDIAVECVKKGGNIVIAGLSWEALELVSSFREMIREQEKESNMKYGNVHMVCPGYSPLDHLLPRYVSLALLKRLRKLGVYMHTHSSIRYVAPSRDSNPTELSEDNGGSREPLHRVKIYTCGIHDQLDTSSFDADMLVISPLKGQVAHWATDVSAGLEIDSNGRIVVNQEMMASSKIYAAGDCASVPHPNLGRICSFRSAENAYSTGLVAGKNLGTYNHATWWHNKIPILSGSAHSLGVQFTFFGDCSAGYDTHGFWWNTSSFSHKGWTPGNQGGKSNRGPRPVFGTGVVYYVCKGKVRGIMVWGNSNETDEHKRKLLEIAENFINDSQHDTFLKSGPMMSDQERTAMKMKLANVAVSMCKVMNILNPEHISVPLYKFVPGRSAVSSDINASDGNIFQRRIAAESELVKANRAYEKALLGWPRIYS